ncbi:MAG: hypothetical protein ACI86P_001796 [Flavobacteriales bacterium]|jgi:hypothetical protein
MKNPFLPLILVIFLSAIISCNSGSESSVNSDLSIDWIVGDWQRINEVEGKRTYEYWKKEENGYSGLGYTLRDIDTVFMEAMRIHKIHGEWALEIYGPNEIPTIFTFSSLIENNFIADCPSNEFPKTISYSFEDGNLIAFISDSTTSIPFEFEPLIE